MRFVTSKEQDYTGQVHAQSASQLIGFYSKALEDLHARSEEGKAPGQYAGQCRKA